MTTKRVSKFPLRVMDKYAEQTHIEGPVYLEDEEGTVRAEGICCREHARLFAAAPDLLAACEAALADLNAGWQYVKCEQDAIDATILTLEAAIRAAKEGQ